LSGADGNPVWEAPRANAQAGSSINLTAEGEVQVVAPDASVLWSNRGN